MLIRCEKCSTVYQLDEKVLPPAGAPVQCTRCQHVFTARPPQAPGQTLAVYPAVELPGGEAPAPPGPAPFAEGSGTAESPGGAPVSRLPAEAPAQAPASPQAGEGAAANAPSPHGTAIYMGPAVAPPTTGAGRPTPAPDRRAARPPPPRDQRNDTLRRFVRDHQHRNLWRWLGPVLGLTVVLLVILIVSLSSGRHDPKAVDKRNQALRLLPRDDRASLYDAVDALESAHKIDPKYDQAEADRALGLFLEATSLRGEVDLDTALLQEASQRPADQALRERLAEREYKIAQANRLKDQAFGIVSALYARRPGLPEVRRALAVAYALYGPAGQAAAHVNVLRSAKFQDAWVDFADSAAALQGQDKSAAVARLGAFATVHPEILRARWLLARAQLDLGYRDAARATLDGLLDANRSHELAMSLKSRLLGLPPGGAVPARVPAGNPPQGTPGPLPRK